MPLLTIGLSIAGLVIGAGPIAQFGTWAQRDFQNGSQAKLYHAYDACWALTITSAQPLLSFGTTI